MLTSSAARSVVDPDDASAVTAVRALVGAGWSSGEVRSQLRAHRWQRIGRAIVRHNGEPTDAELRRVALINAGPRSALTAFTALEEWGLTGWPRERIHVIVPRGARVLQPAGLDLRIHYTDDWRAQQIHAGRGLHRQAPAAILAAATFRNPRSACGVLAACVQQRLVRAADMTDAVRESSRLRHRAVLLAAACDIEQGAEALSEIDFVRLCRTAGLPAPDHQVVRVERSGRRRYLDASWDLPRGRRLVVEVDGALHLIAERWWDDQLRQNEIVLQNDPVLRFPSVIVRCEPALIVDQLRRGLLLR